MLDVTFKAQSQAGVMLPETTALPCWKRFHVTVSDHAPEALYAVIYERNIYDSCICTVSKPKRKASICRVAFRLQF